MKRILIVDDDPLVQKAVARSLRLHGHTTAMADDVEDARRAVLNAAAMREAFDVVVTDIDMPGGTGFELATHLRADLKAVPIFVFMSGMVTNERHAEAVRLGGTLLTKGADTFTNMLFELVD